MKFPQMNKQPSRTVTVPNLAGGTNYRDSVSSVLDNQLTDCKNMWYHGGMLKTRPGFKTSSELCVPLDGMYASDYNVPTTKVLDVYKTADGVSKRLVMHYTANEGASFVFFNWIGDNVYETVPGITVYYEMSNIFVIQSKDEIFAFICGEGNYDIYKLTEDESGWNLLSDEDYYVPTILTNGLSSLENKLDADTRESINILSDYVKIEMSSVNLELLSSLSGFMDYHYMSYGLYYPDGKTDFSQFKGKTVTVEINNVEHKVTLDNEGCGNERDYNSDGLKLRVEAFFFKFTQLSGDGTETDAVVQVSDFSHNNMVVTQPIAINTEDRNKVFLSTQTEWFGGASEGLAGGTRLFLCGNKEEKNSSLLVWSGLNNPLYFPLNGHAYVGNSNSRLTGFGKQSNMLVLFKQFEAFYTYYAQDSSGGSAYFPIVQINSSIGCDMPDTIQLCRNRLVWTNSDGKVYTLVSNSQYSERNIYLVSEMIYPMLKNDPNLSTAAACDWNGYYVLFCKEKVYLMNYDSYGYQYITSYTKNEDANLHIPWYVWELPSGHQATEYYSQAVFTIANKLCCFSMLSKNSQRIGKPMSAILFADESYYYDDMVGYNVETGDFNSVIPYIINCAATTKLFDFSAPNKRKNVTSVGLSFGNNGGVPISVSFISEDGSEDVALEITAPEAEHRAPSYIQSVILNPSLRSVVRVGVKLECDGFMSLDGMTVTYKMLGGAR